jgi:flagellin-like hook-associated protein FlgL
MNNRANDLARLQDGMGLAVKTFEAADKGIKAITKLAENMSAIAKSAKDATTAADRADFQTQFEELRAQMAAVAKDSGFNGINLLGGDSLETEFSEDGVSKQSVTGVDWRGFGSGTAFAATNAVNGIAQATTWNSATLATGTTAIEASMTQVKDAIAEMRKQAAVFGSNLTVVKIREDFTKDMINTLKAGRTGSRSPTRTRKPPTCSRSRPASSSASRLSRSRTSRSRASCVSSDALRSREVRGDGESRRLFSCRLRAVKTNRLPSFERVPVPRIVYVEHHSLIPGA